MTDEEIKKFAHEIWVNLMSLVFHNDYSTPEHQNSGVKKDG